MIRTRAATRRASAASARTIEATPATLHVAGTTLRARAGRVETLYPGNAEWTEVTRADLRRYAELWPSGADPSPWPWLASHGVSRPTASGPSGRTRTRAERVAAGEREIVAWVTREVDAALDECVASGRWGATRAEVIRAAILALAENL